MGTKKTQPKNVVARKRLAPPDNMSAAEQFVWIRMVNACSAEHFLESDIPVMIGFCQAFVQQQRAMDQMKEHPLFIMSDNGKVAQHPLVNVHKSLSGTVSNYAMRLRITPSTRIDTKQAATGSHAPPPLVDDPVDELFAQPDHLDG